MILYAESSGVAAWLFGEPGHEAIAASLQAAEHVVSSDLTMAEVGRAILRAEVQGRVDPAGANALRLRLSEASRRWTLIAVTSANYARSAQRWPIEPVRTLDALHIAISASVASTMAEPLVVLALDHRVRDNAVAVGLPVVPEIR